MLDELERTDPERYQQLMLAMKAQVEGAAMGQPDAIDPSLLDVLKGGAAPQSLGEGKEGIDTQHEKPLRNNIG